MRFKLICRDLGMLTRNLVKNLVHHINNAQLQQVRNTYKVYKISTQCKQGMYVGGSSVKGFLLVCQLVQLQKQISYFDNL